MKDLFHVLASIFAMAPERVTARFPLLLESALS